MPKTVTKHLPTSLPIRTGTNMHTALNAKTKRRIFSNIHLVFTTQNGKRFLIGAFVNDEGQPKQKLDLDIEQKTPTFRAICILVLLAKFQGNDHSDRFGNIKFKVEDMENTWIATLANSRPNDRSDWFESTLNVRRFLTAFRVNRKGNVPPRVEYVCKALPLVNFNIYKESLDHVCSRAELFDLAETLQRGCKWRKDTIAKIIGDTTLPADNSKPKLSANNNSELREAIENLYFHIMYDGIRPKLKDILGGEDVYDEKEEVPPNPDPIKFLESMKDIHPSLCNCALNTNGDTALHLAISYKEHIVRDILKLPGIDLNVKNKKGVTPLLRAVRKNSNKNIIDDFLAKGADFNALTKQGANVIYEAAFGATRNAYGLIKIFIKLGVNCNIICLDGSTPLSIAHFRRASEGVLRILASQRFLSLINNNERQNIENNHQKIKMDQGLKEMFSLAFDEKLRPDGMDDAQILALEKLSHADPLFIIATSGEIQKTQLLGVVYANVNNIDLLSGKTALHQAVERCHPDVVSYLLRNKANPFCQDAHGRTPRELIPVNKFSNHDIFQKSIRVSPLDADWGCWAKRFSSFKIIEEELIAAENHFVYTRWQERNSAFSSLEW